MSSDEDAATAPQRQRRRSRQGGLSPIAELPSRRASQTAVMASPAGATPRASFLASLRKQSSGAAAPAAEDDSDEEEEAASWRQLSLLKTAAGSASRRASSAVSPLAASRKVSSASMVSTAARRDSTAAAAQSSEGPDTDDERWARMQAGAAGKPRTPLTPLLLHRHLSAASAASQIGGAAALKQSAQPGADADSDSEDETWTLARAAASAARSRAGSIAAARPQLPRSSLAQPGPAGNGSGLAQRMAAKDAAPAEGGTAEAVARQLWPRPPQAADPPAKRRFASMSVPAASSLGAQQPLFNANRRATLPPRAPAQQPNQAAPLSAPAAPMSAGAEEAAAAQAWQLEAGRRALSAAAPQQDTVTEAGSAVTQQVTGPAILSSQHHLQDLQAVPGLAKAVMVSSRRASGLGQAPVPWPLPVQHAQPIAALSFSTAPVVAADAVQQSMPPASGPQQQDAFAQPAAQQLAAQPSLAAGFAEQFQGLPAASPVPRDPPLQQPIHAAQTAQLPAQAPAQQMPAPADVQPLPAAPSMQSLPAPVPQQVPVPPLDPVLAGAQSGRQTAEALQTETPRKQMRPSLESQQLPAAGLAQELPDGVVTRIITSARSSMDVGALGSVLPVQAAAPHKPAHAPEASADGAHVTQASHQGSRRGSVPQRDMGQMRAGTPNADQGFTVYENELAAGAEVAEQVMRLAGARAAGPGSKVPEPPAIGRQALEAAIVTAVQSSVAGALSTLSADVAQLHAKLGSWCTQNKQVSQDQRQEMGELRRGTSDSIQAISARLHELEAAHRVSVTEAPAGTHAAPPAGSTTAEAEQPEQAAMSEDAPSAAAELILANITAEAAMTPAPKEAALQAVHNAPSGGESQTVSHTAASAHAAMPAGGSNRLAGQDATSGILKRLEKLEACVACQLDQLSAQHAKRIAVIKGGLHMSVTQAAAAAASLPGSPARAAVGSRPASPERPKTAAAAVPWLEDSAKLTLLPDAPKKAWAQALCEDCSTPQRRPGTAPSPCKGVTEALAAGAAALGRGGAGKHDPLLCKIDRLEAAHRSLLAADRCKAQLVDVAGAAALNRRLSHLEQRLACTAADASFAGAAARAAQTRIAAAEWRIEKVATACAATVRTLGSKQERLGGCVGQAKQAAALADAKCAALGAELARLWRESGVRRLPTDTLGRRLQRVPKCPHGGGARA